MPGDPIKVTGLREFQRALKGADAALPKRLRVVLNDAATIVINWATARMPRVTGRAIASVKARSSQRESRVAIGGTRAPYVPWLDFGGSTGPNKSVHRPFLGDGRYLYPGLRANHDEVTKIMEAGLLQLGAEAGLEVTESG